MLLRALPGAALVALGAAVLVGWWTRSTALGWLSWHPGAMTANTALALVIAGIALGLARSPRLSAARRALGLVVAAIGLATLAEHALGRSLGIDELVARAPRGIDDGGTGRMAANTAFGLAVAGVALAVGSGRRARTVVVQVGAALVGLTALVALLGHAFDIPRLQSGSASREIAPMAIQTALAFLVLAGGLLLAGGDAGAMRLARSPAAGGVLVRRLVPAVLLLPAVVGFLGLEGERHGLFGTSAGVAIFAAAMTVVFGALVLATAALLERVDAERRERAAREVAMVDSALDAIVGVDEHGRIVEFNAAAEQVFGYRRADVLGRMLDEMLVPPAYRAQHVSGFSRYLTTREASALLQARVEVTAMRSDGTEFEAELAVTEGASGGRPLFTAFFRDISDRAAAERQRLSLEAQLRQSQKMEAVGRLAGGVAHDFNNLLTVVAGHAELLLQRLAEDDPRRVHAAQIDRAAEKATALTAKLLAISRRQVLEARVVDLNSVVADVAPMIERLLADRAALDLRLAPEDVRVRADPSQLDHALLNLAVNARDAMPDGGRLTIETRPAWFDEADADRARGGPGEPGAFVALVVRDTGVGMDAAVREHLFEPFFTTKPKGEGTGLGLATVHGIATQLGGAVQAQSAPGEGTAFTIYLPRVEAPVTTQPEPPGPLVATSATGRETILLVEDDGDVRALTRQILEGCGYSVVVATDGAAALAICEERPDVIDLVVTDIVMPGMNGLDLRRRLRSRLPHVRVLCMSGYSERLAAGTDAVEEVSFIQKPFTAIALAARVRSLLDGDGEADAERATDRAGRA